MKYLHKISLLLSIFAVGLFASCDTDNEGAIYEPATPGAKFQVEEAEVVLLPSDAGTSTFLFRNNTETDLTVSLNSALYLGTDKDGNEVLDALPEGISVPSSVTFAKGEGKVAVPINVGDVTLGATYTVKIALANESDATEIAPVNSTLVSITKDYVWKAAGTLHIASEWMGDEWDDVLQVAEGTETLYRAYQVYIKGYSLKFWIKGDKAIVEPHACDYSSTYGAIWAEGEGTFKDNTATMTIEFYVPGVGSFGEYVETITIP